MVGQIAKKKNSLSYILFDDFKKKNRNTRAEKYFQERVLCKRNIQKKRK